MRAITQTELPHPPTHSTRPAQPYYSLHEDGVFKLAGETLCTPGIVCDGTGKTNNISMAVYLMVETMAILTNSTRAGNRQYPT